MTRTGGESGIPTLNLEMAKGATRDDTPQKFLDRFKTALTFDPLAFIGMDLEEQLEMLHKLSGVTLDFKELEPTTNLTTTRERSSTRARRRCRRGWMR